MPKEKAICAIGSYGYDWTTTSRRRCKKGQKPQEPKTLNVQELSTQEAWQAAYDADAQIDLDHDSLNVALRL